MSLEHAFFYALALLYALLGVCVARVSIQFVYEMRADGPRSAGWRVLDSVVATAGVLVGVVMVLIAVVGAAQGPP